MARSLCFWVILAVFGPPSLPAQQPKPPSQQQEQEPPEEDAALKPKEYEFNPMQAEKEVRVGAYYFRKGSYRAAANRFREATRWNPTLAEAFLRLGEAEEKLKNPKSAREAYAKFLELEPSGKDSAALRKKLAAQH